MKALFCGFEFLVQVWAFFFLANVRITNCLFATKKPVQKKFFILDVVARAPVVIEFKISNTTKSMVDELLNHSEIVSTTTNEVKLILPCYRT